MRKCYRLNSGKISFYSKPQLVEIGMHHSAWLDKNIDDMGESVMDFIISNNLQIMNSSPFEHTYEKIEPNHQLILLCALNQSQDDFAVTNCVVESAKQSIGTRIIWKGNKSWWTIHFIEKEKKIETGETRIFDQEYRIIEGRKLFSQFKIPALMESTGKIDKEKAEIYSEETKEHYQLVKDEITAVIDMNKDVEMSCYPL
ncbi:hypothetical protein RFI_01239 [Reticulomyxa filosa]|uniref:Uncharacterized protein n=1 Tax=Reticulomyxa filosa TaxID=46433 RepID=X6PCI9_RETFI|nr:hypothetical protein RFI_01239 [Reticulomyxa filosa]|eukprot:ETO35823.1 hypothetical protein RFI_01239 [Reticulomyxa filosa]